MRVLQTIAASMAGLALTAASAFAAPRPDVVLISIDTLRADRLSSYGYERATSPVLDSLIDAGVRFDQARTVEPLTSPALCSMLTSLDPHEHGSSRNGLRIQPGLESLPKLLANEGYTTAAFVGNWTLRDKLSGLAEHFDVYEEVLKKKRWLGLFSGEADAGEINRIALDWLDSQRRNDPDTPVLLWVHYVEPHAPYRMHDEFAERLGFSRSQTKNPPAKERYDTEIAAVDAAVGRLLAGLDERRSSRERLTVFAADHGESLGEHNYWGHGRHLYEPSLRIPMSIVWPGRIEPGVIDAPASILDLATTVAGLLDIETPDGFRGFDWTAVMRDEAAPPIGRETRHQAHKGAVLTRHESENARRAGLLAVARVRDGVKEIFRLKGQRRRRFDLSSDAAERSDLARDASSPTPELALWIDRVTAGLRGLESLPIEPLDEESIEALRALGYAD